MSAEVTTAVLNEAFELSHMFRENAALKHGLPNCPAAQRVKVEDQKTTPEVKPPVVNITNNIPANNIPVASDSPTPGEPGAVSVPSSSLLRAAAPWLLTAAGAGGIAAGVNYLLADKPPVAPAATQPTEQDGSLLQYLEDAGKHLPEGAWPTK